MPAVQNLVGLNGDSERLSYFGVTNPHPGPAVYRLRFFDAAGREMGRSDEMKVSAFGQRQFQSQEIVSGFGVSGSDYRVRVETVVGGPLYPYGSNLRLATGDPSFVEPQEARVSRAYLVGVLGAPGLFGSQWRTDGVLANPGSTVLRADLTFTNIGNFAAATAAVPITLQPGETRRLIDVLKSQWGLTNAIGVLAVRYRRAGLLATVALGVLAGLAVWSRPDTTTFDLLPVVAGTGAALLTLSALARRARSRRRRVSSVRISQ